MCVHVGVSVSLCLCVLWGVHVLSECAHECVTCVGTCECACVRVGMHVCVPVCTYVSAVCMCDIVS